MSCLWHKPYVHFKARYKKINSFNCNCKWNNWIFHTWFSTKWHIYIFLFLAGFFLFLLVERSNLACFFIIYRLFSIEIITNNRLIRFWGTWYATYDRTTQNLESRSIHWPKIDRLRPTLSPAWFLSIEPWSSSFFQIMTRINS